MAVHDTTTEKRTSTEIDGDRVHLYQILRIEAEPAVGIDRRDYVIVNVEDDAVEVIEGLDFEGKRTRHTDFLPGEPQTTRDGEPVLAY